MSSYKLEFLKFRFKRFIERFPHLYVAVARSYARLRKDQSGRVVSRDSAVCIEGFPRCANSFAWHAFIKYTGIKTGIATHLHSPAQIEVALDYGVPTIVNIRNPRSCITSLQALSIQYQGDNKRPNIWDLRHDLNFYIYFYESLIPRKKEFVVADFSRTISDFGSIMQELNVRFSQRFVLLVSEDKAVSDLILEEKQGEGHLGPNAERDLIKEKLLKEYDDSPLTTLKAKAQAVYEEFIA